MKQYCTFCAFYKEDVEIKNHPVLERQGVNFGVRLCKECYAGLCDRQSSMRDWIGETVCVPYTTSGPHNKLEDTLHTLITTVQYAVLRTVHLQTKDSMGFIVGKLEAYSFENTDRSIVGWVPLYLSSQVRNRAKIGPQFFAKGQNIQSCSRFMLYGQRGYIQ